MRSGRIQLNGRGSVDYSVNRGEVDTLLTPVLMPAVGNSMEEGIIVAWKVQEGQYVRAGDVLCEIETDKAIMEYESPAEGNVARIVAEVGATVKIREPIAYLSPPNAGLNDAARESSSPTRPESLLQNPSSGAGAAQRISDGDDSRGNASMRSVTLQREFRGSPAARRAARERGIDLSAMPSGSGPGGRILVADVLAWQSNRLAPGLQLSGPPDSGATRSGLSKMRRIIGQRLQESKQTIPHFYVRMTISADRLVSAHKHHQPTLECTLNDWIVLACGRAMAEFDVFRSRLDGDQLVTYAEAHVGIAVALEDGLVVPVVQNVDRHSLATLAAAARDLVDQARRGIVSNAGSGTMTVSNLGMLHVEEFAAIINPPEVAILAVGAIREQVVVKDGWLRPGRVMTMTLSADHRLVDGVIAAKFLAKVRTMLEDPSQLLSADRRNRAQQ